MFWLYVQSHPWLIMVDGVSMYSLPIGQLYKYAAAPAAEVAGRWIDIGRKELEQREHHAVGEEPTEKLESIDKVAEG